MIPSAPNRSQRFRSHVRGRRGLTLLEVLLSLLIFVGAMAAIGQLVSNGVRAALHSRMQTQAILRCESKVAEVVGGVVPFQTAVGVPFPDDPNWTWSLQVQPGPHPSLLRMDVKVDHAAQNGLGRTTFTLSRLLRDPQIYLDAESDAMRAEESQSQGTQ
jgi:general secretion pathway protein I